MVFSCSSSFVFLWLAVNIDLVSGAADGFSLKLKGDDMLLPVRKGTIKQPMNRFMDPLRQASRIIEYKEAGADGQITDHLPEWAASAVYTSSRPTIKQSCAGDGPVQSHKLEVTYVTEITITAKAEVIISGQLGNSVDVFMPDTLNRSNVKRTESTESKPRRQRIASQKKLRSVQRQKPVTRKPAIYVERSVYARDKKPKASDDAEYQRKEDSEDISSRRIQAWADDILNKPITGEDVIIHESLLDHVADTVDYVLFSFPDMITFFVIATERSAEKSIQVEVHAFTADPGPEAAVLSIDSFSAKDKTALWQELEVAPIGFTQHFVIHDTAPIVSQMQHIKHALARLGTRRDHTSFFALWALHFAGVIDNTPLIEQIPMLYDVVMTDNRLLQLG